MSKIAVVLFNLGGPDSKEAIRPYLTNFFTDPNIIRLPYIFRRFVAYMIAKKRSKGEALVSYERLGFCSPLLKNSEDQGQALKELLATQGIDANVYICMRYWNPMAEEIVEQIKNEYIDRVVLLPMYPQYSTTTTRSSLQEWKKAAQKHGLEAKMSMLCCYPVDEGFIQASVSRILPVYEKVRAEAGQKGFKAPRVLFSAHGLPKSIIDDGDPYQYQCEVTAQTIVNAMGVEDLDWQICYQSRVGPMEWVKPSTDEALEKAAHDQVPVLVFPHAFVNEHVETLVEIEEEYREKAHEIGVPLFERVETVGTAPDYIAALAKRVKQLLDIDGLIGPAANSARGRFCPADKNRCCLDEQAGH